MSSKPRIVWLTCDLHHRWVGENLSNEDQLTTYRLYGSIQGYVLADDYEILQKDRDHWKQKAIELEADASALIERNKIVVGSAKMVITEFREEIEKLRAENQELKEYKSMHERLCK